MVNVDISNVWTCLSLPDLLQSEQAVFEAHAALFEPVEERGSLMGWLRIPEAAGRRVLHRIGEVAHIIREESQVLLVCGCGGAYHGAKAAVEAMQEGGLQILFVGQSLCSRQWQALTRALEGKDYSLLIISSDGTAPACNLTVRTLRWMMERKYGDEAKARTYVATLVGTPFHTMAQEEGYELFPLPKEPGGRESVLTAAALLPMAAAGIDPAAVMQGVAESHRALDLRAFENPLWLYAAAKYLLAEKGRNRELLCLTDHSLQGVGRWLQHRGYTDAGELSLETVCLPGEPDALDALIGCSGRVFETLLRFAPSARKIPVEMDWKDYDALGFLAGKHIGDVQEALLGAMPEIHNDAGVPVICVDAGEFGAESFGAMLHFFELASHLTARLLGHSSFEVPPSPTRQAALRQLGVH